jgi:hypothetical protein
LLIETPGTYFREPIRRIGSATRNMEDLPNPRNPPP